MSSPYQTICDLKENIQELRELNAAACREIAYSNSQEEKLRELNAELLELLHEYVSRVAWVEIIDLTERAKEAIAKAEARR